MSPLTCPGRQRKGRARKSHFADRGHEGPGDRRPAGSRAASGRSQRPRRPRPAPPTSLWCVCSWAAGPARPPENASWGFLGSPGEAGSPLVCGDGAAAGTQSSGQGTSPGAQAGEPGTGAPAGGQHPHTARGPRPGLPTCPIYRGTRWGQDLSQRWSPASAPRLHAAH